MVYLTAKLIVNLLISLALLVIGMKLIDNAGLVINRTMAVCRWIMLAPIRFALLFAWPVVWVIGRTR